MWIPPFKRSNVLINKKEESFKMDTKQSQALIWKHKGKCFNILFLFSSMLVSQFSEVDYWMHLSKCKKKEGFDESLSCAEADEMARKNDDEDYSNNILFLSLLRNLLQ